MAANSLIPGLFLTLIFPKIIACGRKWYSTTSVPLSPIPEVTPTALEDYEPQVSEGEEPTPALPLIDVLQGARFDLLFARSSILLDGVLTDLLVFATQGWNMYLGSS